MRLLYTNPHRNVAPHTPLPISRTQLVYSWPRKHIECSLGSQTWSPCAIRHFGRPLPATLEAGRSACRSLPGSMREQFSSLLPTCPLVLCLPCQGSKMGKLSRSLSWSTRRRHQQSLQACKRTVSLAPSVVAIWPHVSRDHSPPMTPLLFGLVPYCLLEDTRATLCSTG